jgi:hypothetical protein
MCALALDLAAFERSFWLDALAGAPTRSRNANLDGLEQGTPGAWEHARWVSPSAADGTLASRGWLCGEN